MVNSPTGGMKFAVRYALFSLVYVGAPGWVTTGLGRFSIPEGCDASARSGFGLEDLGKPPPVGYTIGLATEVRFSSVGVSVISAVKSTIGVKY